MRRISHEDSAILCYFCSPHRTRKRLLLHLPKHHSLLFLSYPGHQTEWRPWGRSRISCGRRLCSSSSYIPIFALPWRKDMYIKGYRLRDRDRNTITALPLSGPRRSEGLATDRPPFSKFITEDWGIVFNKESI